jgi:hypothetical protein
MTDIPVVASELADGDVTVLRYAESVARRSRIIWIDETPWAVTNRLLRPLPMPHRLKSVDRAKLRAAIKETDALLAQWTEGWDTETCDWWYVCCDQPDYDVSSLRRTVRYAVGKGLRECEVRRVEAQWFAENGFPVYEAGFRHYGATPVLTEDQFAEEFRRHALYPGRETWGAFINGELVAYATCIVIEDAVAIASSKSNPAYFKSKPNNAVQYTLTRHYLRERRLQYVMSGARVLAHDTNIQEFNEKMGYRKVYCPLRLELSSRAALAAALYPTGWARRLGLRTLFPNPVSKLDALASALQISRSCRDVKTPGDRTPDF